jgi:hypothetical protein
MTRAFEDYQDWSEEFTKVRKEVGNIDLVLGLWKAKVPGTWADRVWSGKWGYRKNSKEGK